MGTVSRQKTVTAGTYTYTVLFEPAEEGGYTVTVPILPGCITEGDTFEEAEARAKDAILCYLAGLQEDGEDIPVEHGQSITHRIAVTPACA